MEVLVQGGATPVVVDEFDLATGEKLCTSPGHVGLVDASLTPNLTSITLAGLAQALSPCLVSNREVAEVGAAGVGTACVGATGVGAASPVGLPKR